MFMSYAENQSGNVYSMLNLEMRKIVMSCDIIGLRNCGENTRKEWNNKDNG